MSLMNTAVVVWLGIMAVIGLIMVVVKMKKKS
ncbi:MAG: LPXTG cell wall anchor domain-containing protein [Synergistota bacterium]|nr:LPXTG cell wall anchor domain-containing protein [Synergistota bacterium]